MKRYEFVTGIAGMLASPSLVLAQRVARVPTLGVLSFTPDPTPEQIANGPTTRMLAEMGWIEGKTLAVERRSHAGRDAQLPELAADLVARGVDVILALGPAAAVAAARATKTIPVLFGLLISPIGLGLANSLARPAGNVTGVASVASNESYAKPFEFLREIKPEVKKVTVLAEQVTSLMNVAGQMIRPRTAQEIADGLEFVTRHTGIELTRYPIGTTEELEAAFAAIVETRSQGLYTAGSTFLFLHRRRIAEFALRQRLPSVSTESPMVDGGVLLSYGFDVWATIQQSLRQVDRVLRGAKPADMPIEQPTRFELVINMKTARQLGISIPSSVLLRVDRLIE